MQEAKVRTCIEHDLPQGSALGCHPSRTVAIGKKQHGGQGAQEPQSAIKTALYDTPPPAHPSAASRGARPEIKAAERALAAVPRDAEAAGAQLSPPGEVRLAEPPPLRKGGRFGAARSGAADGMVGDGEEQAPPHAPELKYRRKSPRFAAEAEPDSGGAQEGERRGRA